MDKKGLKARVAERDDVIAIAGMFSPRTADGSNIAVKAELVETVSGFESAGRYRLAEVQSGRNHDEERCYRAVILCFATRVRQVTLVFRVLLIRAGELLSEPQINIYDIALEFSFHF